MMPGTRTCCPGLMVVLEMRVHRLHRCSCCMCTIARTGVTQSVPANARTWHFNNVSSSSQAELVDGYSLWFQIVLFNSSDL